MAEILLHPNEIHTGDFPDVCVVCGASHTTPTVTKMAVVVAENPLIRTLRVQDVSLPLCSGHKWHFYRQRIHIVVGALCMAMFLPCAGLATLVLGPFVRDLPFGWVFAIASLVIPFVVGAIIMYVGRYGNVQAGDITDDGVLVVNLSDQFVNAVLAARVGNKVPE